MGILVLSLGSGILGYINQYNGLFLPEKLIGDFYANVSSELASIAITVLIIDFLNERQQIKQNKEELILQLASPTNLYAKEAARILKNKKWMKDGTLRGAYLSRANLSGAFLAGADLQEANLLKADFTGAYLQDVNLQNAKVTDVEMCKARYLVGATMPNGKRYDGRYNLPGDLRWMTESKQISIDNIEAIASWYDISVDAYLEGQMWASKNLDRVRAVPLLARKEDEYLRSIPYITTITVAQLKKLLSIETSFERVKKWHFEESNRKDRPKRKSVLSMLERKMRTLSKE